MKHKKILKFENEELAILLMGRNGGKTTVKILDKILDKPCNANQLSKTLNLDYNTIIHHTNIMRKYKYITKKEISRIYYFRPTDKLINNLKEYNIIKEKMEKE